MEKKDVTVFTPVEVAEIMAVKETTVLKWLRGGILPGFKAGRLWRISESHLSEFMKGRGRND